LLRSELLECPVQRLEHGNRVQDLPDRCYELAHFAGHAGQMRGKVEYRSPNVGPTLLSLLWLLGGACLVL
jgi:hypothetical protein